MAYTYNFWKLNSRQVEVNLHTYGRRKYNLWLELVRLIQKQADFTYYKWPFVL